MSAEHDNHGSTPAAWTLVIIVMIGFLVASIAFVAASETMVFVGVGIIVLGCIVGKVMQMMASEDTGSAGVDQVDRSTSSS
jgi:hypothetical protein